MLNRLQDVFKSFQQNDVNLAHQITVFSDQVRIDVQTRTPGIDFADVWRRRETLTYQGQDFFVLSKKDLIASKGAAARKVDLEDVRLLELPDQTDEST